jgi:type IV fimbrial biogenesis protein FimT
MLVRSHGNVMHARGFTLIELMVVLSIAAIVLAIGVPNLSFLIGSMNARSASFDLIADLALARSEAIKRNQPVTVTAVGGSWASGWRVTAGATTLRERAALPPVLAVTSASTNLQFGSNGRLVLDDPSANMTWAITSSNATPRCVVITPTGSARSKVGSC